MTREELQQLQALPLEVKIQKSKNRIKEWVEHFGEDGVYISYSGGKDSTVLLHLVRSIYPNIKAVFVDTGLEYPEIKEFVNRTDNVEVIKPTMNFTEVIKTYGYPVISKEQSRYIYDIRTSTPKMRELRLNGSRNGYFKLSDKWKFMLDADFKISNKCCDVMKKNPIKRYERATKRVPFIGTLAEESNLRTQKYLRAGCNAFEQTRPSSQPISFWTNKDILLYIALNNLEIASVYGEVVTCDGRFQTTGVQRTGCVFCAYGVHLEKGKNRFQMLQETHPQLHDYCLNKLGFKKVLEYMNIPHSN